MVIVIVAESASAISDQERKRRKMKQNKKERDESYEEGGERAVKTKREMRCEREEKKRRDVKDERGKSDKCKSVTVVIFCGLFFECVNSVIFPVHMFTNRKCLSIQFTNIIKHLWLAVVSVIKRGLRPRMRVLVR